MSPPTCDTRMNNESLNSTPTFSCKSFEYLISNLFSNPAKNKRFLKLETIEEEGGVKFSKTPPVV